MGTGKTVPAWVNETFFFEKYGWTERELYEEVSEVTVLRLLAIEREREKSEKAKEATRRAKEGASRARSHGRMR